MHFGFEMQKKLMQAGPAWVSLGASSTNMYLFKHKMAFIVSRNKRSAELAK